MMVRPVRRRLIRLASLLPLLLIGCERTANPPPVDSSIVATPGGSDTGAASTRTSWDPALGPVFIVAGESQNNATVPM